MTLVITQYEENTNIKVTEILRKYDTLQDCFSAIEVFNNRFELEGYYFHFFISTCVDNEVTNEPDKTINDLNAVAKAFTQRRKK